MVELQVAVELVLVLSVCLCGHGQPEQGLIASLGASSLDARNWSDCMEVIYIAIGTYSY